MRKQIGRGWQSSLLATIAVVLTFGAFSATVAQEKSIGERYGSREPRTCADMKAPARGAITAALAEKYFICAAERLDGYYLFLVENVKVEVGAGRPYNPNMDLNVPEIDVRFPLYPIRGSYSLYSCQAESDQYLPGRNCTRYEHKNAKGHCYKTAFGDWRCFQMELTIPNENIFNKVPPPKGGKAPVANQPVGPKTVEPKTTAGRDENNFVKPDFSEMEKYFDNIRYDYNFATREMNIVGTMKKVNNPNGWLVEYLDTDGAKITWGNTILRDWHEPSVGKVVKMYVRAATEKQMRDEVKKIVVTRVVN